jgi:hypothetical protein
MRNRTLSGASAVPVVASPSTDLKRRRFLFSLGAGGAAAAAAATAAVPGASVAQVATTDSDDTGSGYRETLHVRDYYRTAKF